MSPVGSYIFLTIKMEKVVWNYLGGWVKSAFWKSLCHLEGRRDCRGKMGWSEQRGGQSNDSPAGRKV